MRQSITIQLISTVLLTSTILASVSFENYFYINGIQYFTLALGVCIIVSLIVSSCSRHKSFHISINRSDILVLLWIIYYFSSFIVCRDYNKFFNQAIEMLILFYCYFFYRFLFSGPYTQGIIGALYVISFFGMTQSIYAILQIIGILPNIFQFHFGGSYGNPGDLANVLTLTYLISLGLFFQTKYRKMKLVLFLGSMFQMGVIILSMARTAWIASGTLSLILIWYFQARWINHSFLKSLIKKRTGLSLMFVLCILVFISLGLHQMYKLKQSSANGRIFLYKLSTMLVVDRPLFGHGYGSFFHKQHQKQIEYFEENPDDIENGWLANSVVFAFNDYLQISIEFGCVLLIIIVSLLSRLLGFKTKTSALGNKDSELLFICRVGLCSILICMCFSYPLQNLTIILCFFILISIISAHDQIIVKRITIRYSRLSRILIVAIFFLGLVSHYSIRSINYGLKWKLAFNHSIENQSNYVSEYENLYKYLRHDLSFIHNYGSILFQSGNYEKCIAIYEDNRKMCLTTDILLMLGQSYYELKNYKKAIENYNDASFLVPHKFVPKYSLFLLYKELQEDQKAIAIAKEISTMKIKVYSEEVRRIKTDVNKYLFNL